MLSELNQSPPQRPRRCLSFLSIRGTLKMPTFKRLRLRTTSQFLIIGVVALSGIGIIRGPHSHTHAANAQNSGDAWTGLDIAPTGYLNLTDPTVGLSPDFVAATPTTNSIPFYPPDANYDTDKAISNQANQNVGPRPAQTANTPTPLAGVPTGSSVAVEYALSGLDRNASSGDNDPPDTHGAVGNNYYVQVVNSQVAVYPRLNGGLGSSVKCCPLSTLFANPAPYTYPSGFNGRQGFFDPRAIYDRATDRYIVMAAAFPESSSVQYLFVAVSAPGTMPFVSTDQYAVHRINVNIGNNKLFDYPSIGIDQNALIFTGNIYTGYNAVTGKVTGGGLATLFCIPKSRMYNMAPPYTFSTPPYYSGLVSTLQPPIKLDSTPYTFLLAAPYAGFHYPGSTGIKMYRLSNTGQSVPSLAGPYSIQVPGYYAPRNAKQPAGTDPYTNRSSSLLLNTLDGRFQSQCTQVGSSIFNVHCINSASAEQNIPTYPTNCWYEIGTGTDNPPYQRPTLKQRQMFWVSSNSDDFHPTIAADDNRNVYLTWNATNTRANQNVQIWCTGRAATDPLNTLRPFVLEYQSPVPYLQVEVSNPTGGIARWGDYAFVTIDPLNAGRAWSVNEMVTTTNVTSNSPPQWKTTYDWGSQIFRFSIFNNGQAL